nr:hypothetical protein [Tanacetum cinerariifolium]
MEAIEKRFGENVATKKTQRNLLKQQYKNITAPNSKMLDQTFDRFQKLVSQLELLEEKLSQKDEEEGPNYALMAFASSSSKSEGNPQMDLQDQGVIDSRCSRHMTGNMSYFTDYKEIDRGYVAF